MGNMRGNYRPGSERSESQTARPNESENAEQFEKISKEINESQKRPAERTATINEMRGANTELPKGFAPAQELLIVEPDAQQKAAQDKSARKATETAKTAEQVISLAASKFFSLLLLIVLAINNPSALVGGSQRPFKLSFSCMFGRSVT